MALSFLKRGAEAHQALQQAEKKAAEARKNAEAGGSSGEFLYKYRFWMPEDAETQITFLDGDLNEAGVLSEICYEEHQNPSGQDWRTFYPCTAETEACPLCAAGSKKSFITVFSVIDHTEWTDKKGVVHKDEVKFYAVKLTALKLLRKLAVKNGGLVGCKFDVSRTGAMSPSTGSHLDLVEKYDSLAAVAKAYGVEAKPLNYEEVIQYRSAKELLDLGLGVAVASIGGESEDGEAPDLSASL